MKRAEPVPFPPHCGICEPLSRMREDSKEDGSLLLYRCPSCHPLLVGEGTEK